MRRLASFFKRSGKSDDGSSHASPIDIPSDPAPAKKPSRFFRTLSSRSTAKLPSPVPQAPPVPQAYSSSSSSTESPSPPTPDEESLQFRSNPPLSWLETKKAIPLADASYRWDAHSSFQINRPYHLPGTQTDDSEDDRSSATSSSRSEVASLSIPHSVAPLAYVQSLTANSLTPSLSVPPLLHLPGTPLFPRSANTVTSLPYKETTESTLHRTRLLQCHKLSRLEEQSITAFASRRITPTKRVQTLRLDDDAVKDSKRISTISHGLRAWVSRPCFEDRVSVYTPAPSGSSQPVIVSRVVGSVFGVAALELSPALEVLAGLTLEEELGGSQTPCSSSSVSSVVAAPQARNQPYRHSPSPLRLETSTSSQVLSPEGVPPTALAVPGGFNSRRQKNTVRFEVEDKEDREDHIPLGQIIRIKKGREEKAKFLELQRERRAHEEERLRHEAERRQWEKEKQSWEAEKRAIEEGKRKQQYAQEIVAARKRRESQMYKHGSSPDLADFEPPRRDSSPTTYLRPRYDARRQGSESDSRGSQNGSSTSLHESPRFRVDSHPPPSPRSRPPSVYSSHTLSSTGGQLAGTSMRSSVLSGPSNDLRMQPPYVPYTWTGVPHAPYVPYHPNMDNMPLLPPTPPFMMQQRRRPSNPSPVSDSHQRHSSGEIQPSKRVSVASRTSSSPAAVFSSKDRVSQSQSPPPSSVRSRAVSPNTRPPPTHMNRRQATIT